MRKEYQTPETAVVPMQPVAIICGSAQSVSVVDDAVNDIEIY